MRPLPPSVIPARRSSRLATLPLLLLVTLLLVGMATAAAAQSRVGRDSSSRVDRYGRDLAYGIVTGFGYTAYDQVRNKPEEWGKGWPGYERRLASHTGELLVSETTTEVLAALMNRPLDYQSCRCIATDARVRWAILSSFTDLMPDGGRKLAVPRLVGSFAGSFAQASWRPDSAGQGHLRNALTSGGTTLLIRSGLNIYREFRHPAQQSR